MFYYYSVSMTDSPSEKENEAAIDTVNDTGGSGDDSINVVVRCSTFMTLHQLISIVCWWLIFDMIVLQGQTTQQE